MKRLAQNIEPIVGAICVKILASNRARDDDLSTHVEILWQHVVGIRLSHHSRRTGTPRSRGTSKPIPEASLPAVRGIPKRSPGRERQVTNKLVLAKRVVSCSGWPRGA